jgi:hypothetical protein
VAELDDLITSLAEKAGDVQLSATGELTRAGQPCAAASGSAVELRLHPEIAEAARNTPDAGVSGRGSDWVRFAPQVLDQHARDRIEAWFLSAWRAAGGRT